jgi:hypothetical protein
MLKDKKTKDKGGRPIIRHGAYSYMTKLSLPDNRAYLRPYLSGVREGLILDLGPTEEDLTTAQKLLIDRVVGQTGVIRLIEEHCREQGIFRGARLQPVLAANYGAFTSSLRLNLQALGINARAGEKILSPLEIAAEIDAEKADQEAKASAERAVATSADDPEYPGKEVDKDESGVSRGEGEKQPHHLTQDERSQVDEGQGPEEVK